MYWAEGTSTYVSFRYLDAHLLTLKTLKPSSQEASPPRMFPAKNLPSCLIHGCFCASSLQEVQVESGFRGGGVKTLNPLLNHAKNCFYIIKK